MKPQRNETFFFEWTHWNDVNLYYSFDVKNLINDIFTVDPYISSVCFCNIYVHRIEHCRYIHSYQYIMYVVSECAREVQDLAWTLSAHNTADDDPTDHCQPFAVRLTSYGKNQLKSVISCSAPLYTRISLSSATRPATTATAAIFCNRNTYTAPILI